MADIHPQFIKDSTGQNLVVLSQHEFDTLMEELEELEDMRLYNEARKPIPVNVLPWKTLLD